MAWFAFPIILGTLFNLAFKDIEKNEMLEIIDIAVVDNSEFENNAYFKESLKTLSDKSNENQLFNIKYTNLKKSKELLDKKKKELYVLSSAQPEIIRCKGCKHWDGVDTCDVIDAPVWDNDFCSMAERRTDEE